MTMCCKKFTTTIFLVGLVALGYLGFQRWQEKSMTPEEQITQMKHDLANLDGEIKKNLNNIAQREIEITYLKKEIDGIRTRQEENKQVILAKRSELRPDSSLVRSNPLPTDQQEREERELTRLVDAYKRCQAEVQIKEEKLKAYEEALDAAYSQLVAYQEQRGALEVELAQLETLLAQTRAEEVKSDIHFDQSKLSDIAKRTAELRKKLEVRQKELELTGRYLGESKPKTEPKIDNRDVLSEIDELFIETPNK